MITHILETDGDAAAPPLDHKHNLNIGRARLIWADACMPLNRPVCPEGWVLPGGERTNNRDRAMRVAKNMDRLLSAN